MSVFRMCMPSRSKKAKKYSARSSVIQTPRTYEDDPNMIVWNEQFSSGDQNEASRLAFWNSGFVACVKCGENNLDRIEEKAGIRMNGESYGTEIFVCMNPTCGWETSYQFDDAADECWHYEAVGWPRGIMHYPVRYMCLWVEKHKLPASLKQKFKELDITGDRLIELAKDNQVENTLCLDRKTADQIFKILHDKWGAVLKT